jgi:hypothetical protein
MWRWARGVCGRDASARPAFLEQANKESYHESRLPEL